MSKTVRIKSDNGKVSCGCIEDGKIVKLPNPLKAVCMVLNDLHKQSYGDQSEESFLEQVKAGMEFEKK